MASDKKYHHSLRHRQWLDPAISSVPLDQEVIRRQLDRALALVLDAVGFDDAEPLAMESFHNLVEEYMTNFLRTVERSMRASRRRVPVPLDFQAALAANNLTCLSLLPHLDPPVVAAGPAAAAAPSVESSATISQRSDGETEREGAGPSSKQQQQQQQPRRRHPALTAHSQIQPALFSAAADGEQHEGAGGDILPRQQQALDAILGSDGNGNGNGNGSGSGSGSGGDGARQQRPANVPPGFPVFPSQHTYRARAVFAVRERDPQRIRERASDEGRLGEEALRRLAAKQAELRKAREEREGRDGRARAAGRGGGGGGGGGGDGMDLDGAAATITTNNNNNNREDDDSAPLMLAAGRKRKATAAAAAAAAATAAERAKANKAKTKVAAAAAAAAAAAGVAGVAATKDTSPAALFKTRADELFKGLMTGMGGGEEAGAEGIIAPADSEREWASGGGLNEPVNADRIYWRQAPKRLAPNG